MEKTHLIGNAHLDPAWLWPWQEGFSEILATYRSALDRLKEFDDIIFTSACAVYYQWIEAIDPAMFEEIREYIKQGRWEIVGGWFLQPDCNMPDGESFMRHALLSQRYFKEKFGVTATVGYNVDSFGHNASLPKILNAAGMNNYVFMRPSPQEQGRDEFLFNWKGDDGSQVVAARLHQCYNIDIPQFPLLEELNQRAQKTGLPQLAFYGIGNHGGGPTIQLINQLNQLPNPETRCYASTQQYFEEARKHELPTLTGELQHHARGCYSAESHVKRQNRKCEQNLWAAEVFANMAKHLLGNRYPAESLSTGWKNVLFNQFHDILGGCSIQPVYTDAGYSYGETMNLTEQVINTAIQSMAWQIDTLQGETLPSYKALVMGKQPRWTIWEHEKLGTPVVVFNPHAFPVTRSVQVYAGTQRVTDCQGNAVPMQTVRGEQTNGDDKYNTAFLATVPPMGYAVYRLHSTPGEQTAFCGVTASETHLENSKIRVEFDATTGDVGSIYDKLNQTYILQHPCKAVVLDETECDTWAHNRDVLGPTVGQFTPCSVTVLEEGDVKASVRIISRYQDSTLTRIYTLEAESDGVTVETAVDFREPHRSLKFTFPMAEEQVITKIPFGTVTRNGYTGEEPCGSWFASGNLVVANDGKYGYDTHEGEMRLTALRNAMYADHYGERDDRSEFMCQGVQHFTYALFPYRSNSQAEQTASVLNFGLRRVIGSFHKGKLPQTASCFTCENQQLLISAVKQQEDSEKTVLRCYNMEGTAIQTSVQLFGKTIPVSLNPYAISTLLEDGTPLMATEWEGTL